MLPIILAIFLLAPVPLGGTNEPNTADAKNTIIIKNSISQKDTVYRKFCMNHYPDNFTIYINGKKLNQESSIQINDNTFDVVYAYEWNPPSGKIERAKEVTFQVTDPAKSIDLHFKSWDDPYRICATNAKPLSTQQTSLKQLIEKYNSKN